MLAGFSRREELSAPRYKQPERWILLNLLPLVPSTASGYSALRLSFLGDIFTSRTINLDLSANGTRASPEHLRYLAYAVSSTFKTSISLRSSQCIS